MAFPDLALTKEVIEMIDPDTGRPYTVAEIEACFRELSDMGLVYEKDGRYYAVPDIVMIEQDDGDFLVSLPAAH